MFKYWLFRNMLFLIFNNRRKSGYYWFSFSWSCCCCWFSRLVVDIFNPAVSIMALVKGDLSQSDLMGYILAQILGALFALEIFKRFL